MFAIGVELLSGRYVATAYNDRDAAEWPPHPARFFSALVATWADGEPQSTDGADEYAALEWLERQPAPEIIASPSDDLAARATPAVFVPVNDTAVISAPDRDKLDAAVSLLQNTLDAKARAKAEKEIVKTRAKLEKDTQKALSAPAKPSNADLAAAVALLPEHRVRQPRTFPSIAPGNPVFAFAWPDTDLPPEHAAAMQRLLSRVVRLGHSASLVHARLVTADVVAALERDASVFVADPEAGTLVVRWVSAGQCGRLVDAHHRHREIEPRVMPARYVRYREGRSAAALPIARSSFDDEFMVLARVRGPRLPITACVGVARQLRRALMSVAPQPVAEILSGHRDDGSPATGGHLAIVPLPNVAQAHADGALLGIALVLPRCATHDERAAVMRAVQAFEAAGRDEGGHAPVGRLALDAPSPLELQRVVWGEHGSTTLRPTTWIGPSTHWASATPVALDQNPGDLHDPEPARRVLAFDAATTCVRDALSRLGELPEAEVTVLRSAVLPGSAKPRMHPRYPADARRPQRVLVHVRVVFAAPVRGPLLVGAGRYQGLGLLRPVTPRAAQEQP